MTRERKMDILMYLMIVNVILAVVNYEHHYPPEWNDEVFHKVLEQAENYKRHQEA
ncbi:MAG: DUF3387 domain-containing protein [Veillonellaceae bacterium]|nr:DUF3387 domain-containing protein [Veillonellaceae bacterium]MDD6697413.1 hypothetical protein [Veillonellaceae bacterium]